jgi:pimeloyl-ACP methyl ester carboxylesterase
VLVHGFLSSRTEWDAVFGPLSRFSTVIAPDLPGCGESEKPPPARYAYGFDGFAESLVDLTAALGLGRVALCGHGMGAAVALTVAASHPDLVSRLLLVSPAIENVPLGPFARIAPLPLLGPLAFKQLYGRMMFNRYFRDHAYSGTREVPTARVAAHFATFNAPAAREAAFATMRAMLDTRGVVARVPRVKAPTLVLCGREDTSVPTELGRRFARGLVRARFEVLECGASPAEELPDTFVDIARAFLAAPDGKAS